MINVSCLSQDTEVVVHFNPPEWVVRELFKLKDVSYYGLNNIRDTTAKTSCFQALLHLSYCRHGFTGCFCRLFIVFFFAVVNSQYSSSIACSVHGRRVSCASTFSVNNTAIFNTLFISSHISAGITCTYSSFRGYCWSTCNMKQTVFL